MVYSRIVIRGIIDKEPKRNEDGSVDVILTNTYEEDANKDIRDKGNSVFLVRISKRLYKRHKEQLKVQRDINITGYIKTGLSKKGAPFVYVSPTYIKFMEPTTSEQTKVKINKDKIFNTKPPTISWWKLLKDEDFIEINASEIDIIDDIHINGSISGLDFVKRDEPLYVAVKPYNDKYGLTIGLRALIIAKAFNLNVKAYVTNKTHKELFKRFDIDKENINNINSNEEHEDKERLS